MMGSQIFCHKNLHKSFKHLKLTISFMNGWPLVRDNKIRATYNIQQFRDTVHKKVARNLHASEIIAFNRIYKEFC